MHDGFVCIPKRLNKEVGSLHENITLPKGYLKIIDNNKAAPNDRIAL